jgi:hypothetical protein
MARAFPVPWQAAHATDKTPQTIVPVDCTEPFGRGELAPLYIRVRENGVGKFCFCSVSQCSGVPWAGVGGLNSINTAL